MREAIASKVERLYGFSYDPETEVTVTAGGTQAIFTAIGAMVHPGDEVIIVDPAYDCYAPTVELFGGRPVHVRLGNDMQFDADAVQAGHHATDAHADDQHAAQSGGDHPA